MDKHAIKLSVWAKQNGLSYKTAWRMWTNGTFPSKCEQLATGTVLVHVPAEVNNGVALYARVSSNDQKADLDRQLSRLVEFAAHEHLVVVDSAKEIGSGLNGKRKSLMRLLRNPKVSTIVVEHRDRLARFDLHEIIVSLCSRLYGKRSAENRAKKAVEALSS